MGDTPVQSSIIENKKSMSRQQSSKLLGQMQSVVGSQKVNLTLINSVILIMMRLRLLGLQGLRRPLDMWSLQFTRH